MEEILEDMIKQGVYLEQVLKMAEVHRDLLQQISPGPDRDEAIVKINAYITDLKSRPTED